MVHFASHSQVAPTSGVSPLMAALPLHCYDDQSTKRPGLQHPDVLAVP